MRNLLTNPAWSSDDLGVPLPESAHAVSVCMPRWEDVVAYEEGDQRVIEALQCGYPRFVLHPFVLQLFAKARGEFAREGELLLVCPSEGAAQRASRIYRRRERSVPDTRFG